MYLIHLEQQKPLAYTQTLLSVRLLEELRGYLPGTGLGPILKEGLSLECVAFEELMPAELTLACPGVMRNK